MNVKLTSCTYVLGEHSYGPDEIVDLPELEARDLIAKGSAEPADQGGAQHAAPLQKEDI